MTTSSRRGALVGLRRFAGQRLAGDAAACAGDGGPHGSIRLRSVGDARREEDARAATDRHHPFGPLGPCPLDHGADVRPAIGAPASTCAQPRAWLNWPQMALGLPAQRVAADQARCPPRLGPARREQSLQPGLVLGDQTRHGRCARVPRPTRRACRIASASSRRGAIVAHRPMARGPRSRPASRRRADEADRGVGRANAASRCARSSPVAAVESSAIAARSAALVRPDPRGRPPRRRAPAPRGSDTRSGPRSRVFS